MTPAIIDRDGFIVLGIRVVVKMGSDAIEVAWKERFLPRRGETGTIGGSYYGVFNFLPGDPDNRIEYLAGVTADSLEDIPDGMAGWVVPVGTYAEISAVGQDGIARACREMETEWLPDSGFRRVAGPMFAYTSDVHPGGPKTIWMVNIPVETPERLQLYDTWLREN